MLDGPSGRLQLQNSIHWMIINTILWCYDSTMTNNTTCLNEVTTTTTLKVCTTYQNHATTRPTRTRSQYRCQRILHEGACVKFTYQRLQSTHSTPYFPTCQDMPTYGLQWMPTKADWFLRRAVLLQHVHWHVLERQSTSRRNASHSMQQAVRAHSRSYTRECWQRGHRPHRPTPRDYSPPDT